MIATPPHHDLQEAATNPLCPRCDSASVRILASIEVQYDVVLEAAEEDLRVVDERLGDGVWDDVTPVACPRCGWRGTVSGLRLGNSPDRVRRP
ncbi:MAG: hypothetical protein R6W77_05720 [Trueperaceae bacterium]